MQQNRQQAGIALAHALSKYRDQDTVVVAIPRGGVVVGYEIAKYLAVPFTIAVVRKIGHPQYPEFAIGAVDKDGVTLFDEDEMHAIAPEILKSITENERKEAARRVARYQMKVPVNLFQKNVIITDDGVATGLTLRLAITSVKKKQPKKIIVAMPVMPRDQYENMLNMVDETIVLEPPELFLGSVAAHYTEFEQVSDATVVDLLRKSV